MWVRRYRDFIEDHASDYGGIKNLSVARLSLLRRQAAQLVECELIEARMSERKATPEDVDQHNRLVGNIRRNYEVERIAREVEVTPMDRLKAYREAKEAMTISPGGHADK